MARPVQYLVDPAEGRPRDLAVMCAAVYDVLDDSATTVKIDAYSDFTDQMPEDVRAAELWLRERGSAHGHRDPGMAVEVPHDDATGWAIARAYTPWSIHTVLYDANGRDLATFHDCGYSIAVGFDDQEAMAFLDRVDSGHRLVPVEQWRSQRQEATRRRRRARLTSWLRRRR